MILTAYLDDSGTHAGSEWVTVAGFIASADQWEAFDAKWTPVVKDDWGLPFFHMADFEGGFGQYASWDAAQRRDRLNYLLGFIKEDTMCNVAVSIPVRLFHDTFDDDVARFVGGPYGLAALECSSVIPRLLRSAEAKWPSIDLSGVRIDYVFESGTAGRGQVLEFFDKAAKVERVRARARVLSVGLKDKRDFSPLQAADVLAYEVYKEIPNHSGVRARPRRYPLEELANGTNYSWMYHDKDTLARIAPFVEWALEEGWH